MFALNALCLVAGLAAAAAAVRYPQRGAMLERAAGFLILAGLIPIGAGLPLFR